MGEVELNLTSKDLIIYSDIFTYGDAADEMVTAYMREEIETMWNEPGARIEIDGELVNVIFRIGHKFLNNVTDEEIYRDINPRNNYFRIEEQVRGNISYVDGIGSNSGHFKLDNLYAGSTTAAHEYGHTLGLRHPKNTDFRGQGRPSIMYPRGTLVNPEFQYDPSAPAGGPGGTMHPKHRKVFETDILALKLHKLPFSKNGFAYIGDFSNIYHSKYRS